MTKKLEKYLNELGAFDKPKAKLSESQMTNEKVLKLIEDGRIIPIQIKANDIETSKYNLENLEALRVIVKALKQTNRQFEDFSINKFTEDVDKHIETDHPKQYLRFGKFPKDNISKNHRGDEIVKEEKGLSVWNCVMVNDVPFPILPDNPSEGCLADYFYMLLSDRNVYLVTGDELDEKGSAGEPLLVGNIEIIREYTEDYDYLKKIHTGRNRK